MFYAEINGKLKYLNSNVLGIEPKANNYEIPDQHYDSIMTLPAAVFQTHIHDLSQLSPVVTFKTDNKTFMMECKGKKLKILFKMQVILEKQEKFYVQVKQA
jgi:hypothetical protein